MVQGNVNTLRLFKTNTRYVLGGRPFKLYGYQNALNLNLTTNYDTLLYLDLYLDELHDGDDLVNGVAYNIIATLSGNEDIKDSVTIVVGAQSVNPKIYLDPAFDKIREYQTIEFDVKVAIGGVEIKPDTVRVNVDSEYLAVKQISSGWQLTCVKRSSALLTMTVTVVDKTYLIKQTIQS